MRAQDVVAGRWRYWPSPLPVALGVLVVLLGMKVGTVVGPLALVSEPLPAPVAVAEPETIELELAAVAPAAGPPSVLEPTPKSASSEASRLTEQLDRLIAPAAGPLTLAGDPLQPEPFLQERRELARQQEALAVRQVALEVAETRLRAHVERLEALKAEVETLLDAVGEEDEARLEALVQLYERMRPKQAAAIFDTLDFAVLVPLALRMRDMKLAPILGAMETAVARDLTAEIARREQADLLAEAEALLR